MNLELALLPVLKSLPMIGPVSFHLIQRHSAHHRKLELEGGWRVVCQFHQSMFLIVGQKPRR